MNTTTPTKDKVPTLVKAAAGLGEAAINIGVNLPKNFAFPVFNLGMGVSPTLLGWALMIPRIWDAVTDPVMGWISDNTRSRWGRRKPYMLLGGVLSAAAIVLLCVIPRGADTWMGEGTWVGFRSTDWFYAIYLCAVSMLFYTALTIFSVPYGAMTMELTRDYNERTRVMSFRTLFTYVSGLLIGWLYAIAQSDRFKDPATGKVDIFAGSQFVGFLLAGVLLFTTLVPTFLTGRRSTTDFAQLARRPKVSLFRSIQQTLTVPAFLMIVAAYTVGFLGIIMVIGLGQYVNYFYVFGGDQQKGSFVQGWAHTTAVLCGIVTTLAINRLAGKLEKKTILLLCLCFPLLGGLLSWYVYRPDLTEFIFQTDRLGFTLKYHFHPLALSYAMIWPGLAGLMIITNSLITDLCDLDEVNTGTRREGSYWAVFNWIQKTALSLSLLLSGGVLDWVGFDAKLPAQSEQTLFEMRVWYMAVVSGSILIAMALVAAVPLSRARVEAARATLAERRALETSTS
jgi:glycoside/pentoside/hexuronide:cation symporter, GPH family